MRAFLKLAQVCCLTAQDQSKFGGSAPSTQLAITSMALASIRMLDCVACGRKKPAEDCQTSNFGEERKQVATCNPCNALRSRIHRMKGVRGDLVEGYAEMDGEDKKEFHTASEKLFGQALKHQLTTSIEMFRRKTVLTKFSSEGDFLDEEDLDKKYANKPDQKAAIMANAQTFIHPVREVRVWQDVNFTGTHTEEQEQTGTLKRVAEHEQVVKPKAKAKQIKAAPNPGLPDPEEPQKPLPKGVKARLDKFFEKANALLMEMANNIDTCKAPEMKDTEYISGVLKVDTASQ